MTRRAAALLFLLTSLVLIGATVSDWAVLDVSQTFEGDGGVAVVEQTEPISGAETAGGLLAVGLVGMVVAGLLARYRRAALAGPLLAAVGAVVLIDGWPEEGTIASGPYVAGAALAGFLVVATVVLTRPQGGEDPRQTEPSRFTVEAARGDVVAAAEDMDEWDLAVADADAMTTEDDR